MKRHDTHLWLRELLHGAAKLPSTGWDTSAALRWYSGGQPECSPGNQSGSSAVPLNKDVARKSQNTTQSITRERQCAPTVRTGKCTMSTSLIFASPSDLALNGFEEGVGTCEKTFLPLLSRAREPSLPAAARGSALQPTAGACRPRPWRCAPCPRAGCPRAAPRAGTARSARAPRRGSPRGRHPRRAPSWGRGAAALPAWR